MTDEKLVHSEYGLDPRCYTVAGKIAVWEIIGKYKRDTDHVSCEMGHDIMWYPLSTEEVPEDSDDGRALMRLGCFVDDQLESWGAFG